jgi:hypothetical protein
MSNGRRFRRIGAKNERLFDAVWPSEPLESDGWGDGSSPERIVTVGGREVHVVGDVPADLVEAFVAAIGGDG